jgi:hypothetical protein
VSAPARLPLFANGLALVAKTIFTGRLAPGVTLRVYARGRPTAVALTILAELCEQIAALIVEAATQAAKGEVA